jgi:hypothetical protein
MGATSISNKRLSFTAFYRGSCLDVMQVRHSAAGISPTRRLVGSIIQFDFATTLP